VQIVDNEVFRNTEGINASNSTTVQGNRVYANTEYGIYGRDVGISWLLWGLAHLAFMPANENRISLLSKWLWAIATRERASMLITGHPNQHLDVDVGLVPVGAPAPEPTQASATIAG
jgi:hypothetical protein